MDEHPIAVFFIFLVVGFFLCVLSLAFTTALVALVWNGFGLHNVFNAGTLSFWQCVGVGLIIDFLFGGPSVTVAAR